MKDFHNDFIQKISDYGCRAAEAYGEEDYPEKYRMFYEFLKDNLYFHIDLFIKNYPKKYEQDREMIAYLAILENVELLSNTFKNYDPEKANFYNYFYTYFHYVVKSAIQKDLLKKSRSYKTDIFNDHEERILRRILNLTNDSSLNLTEIQINELSKTLNVSEKKIKEIIIKNNNAVDLRLDGYNIENSKNNNLTEQCSMMKYNKDKYNKEDIEFIALLEKLNNLYKIEFSENNKKIFPILFTNDYICKQVDYVKKKSGAKNREDVLNNHWEDTCLEMKRDEYANGIYLCIKRKIFDYVINKKKILTQKTIAEKLGFSAAYLTKNYKEVLNYIKEKVYES